VARRSETAYNISEGSNSVLSFTTTIRNGAGQTINSHGIFRCTMCSGFSDSSCFYGEITLFVIGGPPVVDIGEGEQQAS
jgi:hypothetical protein